MMKSLFTAGLLLACSCATFASEWDKKTVVEFREAVMVPGRQLAPGKHVIKLLDSNSDRHIVQIFDETETKLEATVFAIPNWRNEAAGKTIMTYWETPAGVPPALRSWFYPGDNSGQEFAYPRKMAEQLSALNRDKVPSYDGPEYATADRVDLSASSASTAAQSTDATAESTLAPVASVGNDSGSNSGTVAANEAKSDSAASTVEPAAAESPVANSSEPQAAGDALPKTASPYGMILVAGATLLAAGRYLKTRLS